MGITSGMDDLLKLKDWAIEVGISSPGISATYNYTPKKPVCRFRGMDDILSRILFLK